ncbi:hypothetical protein A2697_03840 [Candidatus Curtissbacteria bacterium RIFCSPHIGHO2_01_FULL_41_44]|uniref:Uncharacterized protein n=1 Tax=Candidatus Curtissbacteria bacterium RIFCSPLOWO2_01_FULL_42_50 TaxID=1797730 RepID=A0A1F5H7L1_9BACT|nr:MAG: hypothetical protein A2697_03840 [Candidatus Curtissbacteria bacterium RIFCSPHIGHO2_01_FULL_41_44]OGD94298.1 MAG: hypothetical protein A3C33_03000 [Candidatus Curtissbacteria bacterium RIFCSPHIGHO2_02_FULL_42_58]OGD97772.1 MAG: hypothetical protein A3E71_03510 [Candidatus Curtissbacteria bacterium RIFCSPHIGHO2_12_FULL_42_33]OGE00164.1 MAG: hypothetical protein A3B54_02055 [Candidatus Curtissbacteria bacterium RIFCSPLOWO2_01_FULL_42_50]OGE02090.1 MAG: hypothetical protein A3G16_00365 [Ca
MIFAAVGFVILVISFAIALISLIREQEKVKKQTQPETSESGSSAISILAKPGVLEKTTEKISPASSDQSPSFGLPQSLSFDESSTDNKLDSGRHQIDDFFGRGKVLTGGKQEGLSGEWVNPHNSSIK